MVWRLANSLTQIRTQVNAAWPKRSKILDGTIGDVAHSKRKSDHNPNKNQVVQAIDITHDPVNGADMNVLAEQLRESRDPRIKYVIWFGRTFSGDRPPLWTWRKYIGPSDHEKHLHLSVDDAEPIYDDRKEWDIMPQFTDDEVTFFKQLKKNVEGEGSNVDAFKYLIRLIKWLRNKFPGENVP